MTWRAFSPVHLHQLRLHTGTFQLARHYFPSWKGEDLESPLGSQSLAAFAPASTKQSGEGLVNLSPLSFSPTWAACESSFLFYCQPQHQHWQVVTEVTLSTPQLQVFSQVKGDFINYIGKGKLLEGRVLFAWWRWEEQGSPPTGHISPWRETLRQWWRWWCGGSQLKGGIKIIFASSCKSIWKQKHLGSFAAATADEALLSCYQILLTKKNIWVRYLNCYEHVYPGQFSMTNSLPQWMQSILPMNGLHTFHSVLLFFINTCCCLILASSRRLWSSESEHPCAELAKACWQQHWPMTVFKFSICTCKHSETRFKSDFQLVW